MFVDAFVADISARKRVERLHQLSEDRLHAVVETHPNGLLIISDSGAIEMANPALERLFGYAHGALYNQPVERLIPKVLNIKKSNALHVPGDEPWVKLQGVHRDGSLVPIEVSLAEFQEDGRTLSVATVLAPNVHAEPREMTSPTEA
jgi:PAS domain S-box-containing protein